MTFQDLTPEEKELREELNLFQSFRAMLAKKGKTFRIFPLTGMPVDPVVPSSPSRQTSDSENDAAKHGENKALVTRAIDALPGDEYDVTDLEKATGLPRDAIRQVLRRHERCTADYIVQKGQGRRSARYSKKPLPGTDTALIEEAAIDLARIPRNGNGHQSALAQTIL